MKYSHRESPCLRRKLLVNKRVAIPKAERGRIRAAVDEVEKMFAAGVPAADLMKAVDSATGRVGTLGRFHKLEAGRLSVKLRAVRERQRAVSFVTGPALVSEANNPESLGAPW